MKQRLRLLFYFYVTLIAAFMVMKVAFMMYNADGRALSLGDYASVWAHGLTQDLSTTSYLAAPLLLVCIISVWTASRRLNTAAFVYCCVIAPVLALILVSDCILYDFWQFKIDFTIFNYMGHSSNVTGNITTGFLIVAIVVVAALAGAILFALYKVTMPRFDACKKKAATLAVLAAVGGLMFLAVRGGLGRSTMNPGHPYFSSNQFLNHSAVNPAFCLFYSTLKDINGGNIDKLYQYYKDGERKQLFDALEYSTQSDSTASLLTTNRPNVVIVLMEGLGAPFMEPLGGKPSITPNLNSLSREGVFFTRCYANSYRTDRGTVCTFSGYPAFPDFSVMKITRNASRLPSIARSLADQGYSTSWLYGGDKNFTNANSYLLATGYEKVMGIEHFPSSVRETHSWGVTDHIVLDTLYHQIVRRCKDSKPYFMTCQTLASHEDWVVPYSRIKGDPMANAMAYLDNSIGTLVNRLKKSPAWNNLLLIFVPDHGIAYPEGMTESNSEKYHIPILWTGGAVKAPATVDRICNQTDLAATLLGQLGISHKQFAFSRDVLSATYTYPCAIHTFNHGVCFIDSTGTTVEDLTSGQTIVDTPTPSTLRLKKAHAFLQTAINDFKKK